MGDVLITVEEDEIVPESLLFKALQDSASLDNASCFQIIKEIKEGLYMIKRKYTEEDQKPYLEIRTPSNHVLIENIG